MSLSESERLQFRLEPTPEVVEGVYDTIRTHEAAISFLDERIATLHKQVQTLQYEQAKHRAVIARCKGMITLARRLPTELLIKIFEHCIEDGGWTRGPVTVSHVCSAWRKAALAPAVWARLYVSCDAANVIGRTRFWLERARGAVGLHVTVSASWRVPLSQIREVMKILSERSTQFVSFKVDASSLRHVDAVLTQCGRAFPELREVEVHTEALDSADGADVSALGNLSDVFTRENAPKLASAAYTSGVMPGPAVFPAHITSAALEVGMSFNHRPLSAALIIGALERLTELRTLTLSMPLLYEHEFIPEVDQARAASLPHLASLTVYGPTHLNELLPHIRAPALRSLHLRSLEDAGYRQQPIGPSLLRFLERSAPPLELLELHDIDLSHETFVACFAALPDLRELRLHESSISEATVRVLNGPRGLCPKLRRLDLRWCGMLGGRSLVELVRSRCAVDDLEGEVGRGEVVEEVGVINCAGVKDEDVLDLARMTVCRVGMKEGEDYCRARGLGCCNNVRYKTRLRLKHMGELMDPKAGYRLLF